MQEGALTRPPRSARAASTRRRRLDAFTRDNDPHGEHDFGAFEHKDERIVWKMDTYDAACQYGSEDPADPTKTTPVLTIMLAEEY